MKNEFDPAKVEAEIKSWFYRTPCYRGRAFDPDAGRPVADSHAPMLEKNKHGKLWMADMRYHKK